MLLTFNTWGDIIKGRSRVPVPSLERSLRNATWRPPFSRSAVATPSRSSRPAAARCGTRRSTATSTPRTTGPSHPFTSSRFPSGRRCAGRTACPGRRSGTRPWVWTPSSLSASSTPTSSSPASSSQLGLRTCRALTLPSTTPFSLPRGGSASSAFPTGASAGTATMVRMATRATSTAFSRRCGTSHSRTTRHNPVT